jgi:hypothetical protein
MIFETDTHRVLIWDNAAWVMIADTDTPPGLQLVATFSINSATTTCDNVFTDNFDNYRIAASVTGVSNTNIGFIRVINESGTTLTTGYFGKLMGADLAGSGTTFIQSNSTDRFPMLWIGASSLIGCSFSCDIFHTRSASVSTSVNGTNAGLSAGSQWAGGLIMGIRQDVAEKNRGFVFSSSAGTTLTGTIRVYGYRN